MPPTRAEFRRVAARVAKTGAEGRAASDEDFNIEIYRIDMYMY